MTTPAMSTELEVIAHQITQTIYSMPFDLASRLQQEQALTCARKIQAALQVRNANERHGEAA